MKAIALKKSSQVECGSASMLTLPPLTREQGTLLAPAQFHNRSLAAELTLILGRHLLKTLHCWKNQLE
jgi:hypothetical protein